MKLGDTKIKTPGSWAIREIKYNEITEELTIHMEKGMTIHYGNVPKKVFQDFEQAESKGKFYNSNIRNVYPYLGQT